MADPADDPDTLRGALHLWPAGALFVGSNMVNEPHRHFTASIILGLEGKVRVRAAPWREAQPVHGILVPPNVEQDLDARGARLAILQVDPECDAFARVAHHFAGGAHVLEEPAGLRLRAAFEGLDGTSSSAFRAWEQVLASLAATAEPRRPLDPRIRKVLGLIKDDFLSPPPAGKLAAAVGLSAGRLIHLFTREMGLPIRRYILWLRLRDVLISIVSGSSLTEAAHHAGFADSAHLSRTFRGMFGFPPSVLADRRGMQLGFDVDAARVQPSPHGPIDDERLSRRTPRRAG